MPFRRLKNSKRRTSRLLLDTLQSPFSVSLRKINSLYAGPCLRVRRSSDSVQADIGFVNGLIDVASLLTFCGSSDGFVVTWYDQSGNAQHATNATTTQQPRIVNAGSLEVSDTGKPAIRFLGTSYKLLTPSFTAYSGGFTVSAVAQCLTTANIPAICTKATGNVSGPWGFSTQTTSGSTVTRMNIGNGTATTAVSPSTANKLLNPYYLSQGLGVWTYGCDLTSVYCYYNGNVNMGAITSGVYNSVWTPGTMTYGDPGNSISIGVFGTSGTAGGLSLISEVVTLPSWIGADGVKYLYREQKAAFTSKDALTIVCIGDSLTLGQSATPDNGPYPAVLRGLVGGTVWVQNYGVGGTTFQSGTITSSIYTLANSSTGAFNRKDLGPNAILCVHGCANDFANGRTPDVVYGYLKTLLTDAKNSDLFRRGINVTTGSPRSNPSPNTDAGGQEISNRIFAYNDILRYAFNGTLAQTGSFTTTQIQSFATANELRTVYGVTSLADLQAITGVFDTDLAWKNTTYYNVDGIHFTDAGYSLFGNAVYTALGSSVLNY